MTWGLNSRTSAAWRGRKCSHSAAARALQLLPRFSMQLVWVANFLPFSLEILDAMQMGHGQRTSSFQKFKSGFVKCIVFASKRTGLSAPSTSLWYGLINNRLVCNEMFLWGHGKRTRSIGPCTMTDDMGCKHRLLKYVPSLQLRTFSGISMFSLLLLLRIKRQWLALSLCFSARDQSCCSCSFISKSWEREPK